MAIAGLVRVGLRRRTFAQRELRRWPEDGYRRIGQDRGVGQQEALGIARPLALAEVFGVNHVLRCAVQPSFRRGLAVEEKPVGFAQKLFMEVGARRSAEGVCLIHMV